MFLPIGDDIESRSFPIIPVVLIALNCLVFAYQVRIVAKGENPKQIQRDVDEFYDTWGLTPTKLAEGEVVGLLSHMFVHGGLMHLGGNMVVLWAFACSLEAGLGGVTLLGFYILWGLAGGLAHAGMEWGTEVPLVGASGAIAGLIGAYTVLYGYDAKIKALWWIGFHPITVRIPAVVFGLGWIGSQLWDASNDPDGFSGIAWYAHIGGFLAGYATSWFFQNDTNQELVRDLSGNLSFQKKKKGDGSDEPAMDMMMVKPGVHLTPDECPYCQTVVDKSHEISPGLRRCPNEECERLVYDGLALHS